MIAASKLTEKRSRRKQKYPVALRPAAELLGVTPGHLSRVLRGERVSPLLQRYEELTRRNGGAQ